MNIPAKHDGKLQRVVVIPSIIPIPPWLSKHHHSMILIMDMKRPPKRILYVSPRVNIPLLLWIVIRMVYVVIMVKVDMH